MSGPAALASQPRATAEWFAQWPLRLGEIFGERKDESTFVLCHRDDLAREDLELFRKADDAAEIARYDDRGVYRPLKTAPNLRHGWQLQVESAEDLRVALDSFYPGRLAAHAAWLEGELRATALRVTLERQTGMYRVAATISDQEIDELVAGFCRSDGGCLRTICWKRDAAGAPSSTLLPLTKFEPEYDQTARGEKAIPLLCQEACNLLVAAARTVVKSRVA